MVTTLSLVAALAMRIQAGKVQSYLSYLPKAAMSEYLLRHGAAFIGSKLNNVAYLSRA